MKTLSCLSTVTMYSLPAVDTPLFEQVMYIILMNTQLPSLFIWAVLAKPIRILVAKELRMRHHRVLEPFFGQHTQRFLDVLCTFDGAVGGAVALAYFEGLPRRQPVVCEIYIPFQKYHMFLNYVVETEGYVVDDREEVVVADQLLISGPQMVRLLSFDDAIQLLIVQLLLFENSIIIQYG